MIETQSRGRVSFHPHKSPALDIPSMSSPGSGSRASGKKRTSNAYVAPSFALGYLGSGLLSDVLFRCISCRERKVKCSGSMPCTTCARRHVECVFGEEDRKVVVSER